MKLKLLYLTIFSIITTYTYCSELSNIAYNISGELFIRKQAIFEAKDLNKSKIDFIKSKLKIDLKPTESLVKVDVYGGRLDKWDDMFGNHACFWDSCGYYNGIKPTGNLIFLHDFFPSYLPLSLLKDLKYGEVISLKIYGVPCSFIGQEGILIETIIKELTVSLTLRDPLKHWYTEKLKHLYTENGFKQKLIKIKIMLLNKLKDIFG